MHDIRAIRQDPDAFDRAMEKRGESSVSARILEMDKARRGAQTSVQELQARANALAKTIGTLRAKGESADDEIAESKEVKQRIADAKSAATNDGTTDAADDGAALVEMLCLLPNAPHHSVPEGADEKSNVEMARWGTPRAFSFAPKPHWELGEPSGGMDFAQAALISGSRFTALKGAWAKLERTLAQFMLDVHTSEHGYTEVSPPLLVRDAAMFGTGQLPKFEAECFATTDGRRLVPTAEVPLTNLVRESIIPKAALPLRFCADTLCFRSEAGAAGRDTRGMLRQHQFRKVELVSVVAPENSYIEHERMTRCAETILERLELPYRRLLLCGGDMGFSAAKTYDLEVWFPSENTYREISSCSNCEAFQARRMQARYRMAENETAFVHTLNGSALAVGRCLAAVAENYQREDGSVEMPRALRPYMGCDAIE
ncbi:MAG: serine--tRNA ligase [Rickettsiales bacterium]